MTSNAVGEPLVATYACLLSTSVLVLYEYVLTLSQEIKCIWKGRPTSVTIVYLLNRYTIVAYSITSILQLVSHSWKSITSIEDALVCWETLSMIWEFVWAVFGALRVYAVGGRNWPLAIVTLSLGLVSLVANAYIYARRSPVPTSSSSAKKLSVPGNQVSITLENKLMIASRTCLIASDILVLYVTWMSMLKLRRMSGSSSPRVSSLIVMMCRDGTIYFLALLLLNSLEIGLYLTNVFTGLSTVITPVSSVIMSRFLLNLRQLSLPQEMDASEDPPSSVSRETESTELTSEYLSTFVGSMGGPLYEPWSLEPPEVHEVDPATLSSGEGPDDIQLDITHHGRQEVALEQEHVRIVPAILRSLYI